MRLTGYIIAGAMAITWGTAPAQTIDDARQMMLDGDYAAALPIFEKALSAKPKDASLNQWVGVCLLRSGNPKKAERYLKVADERKLIDAPRYLAEAAFEQYEFSKATDLLDRYEEGIDNANKKKARKAPKITKSPEADELRRRTMLGQAMLDRVEKIVVIDSMAVDRDEFFKFYHLSPESGTLNSTDVMPEDYEIAEPSEVYMPQSGEFRIWSAPDKDENYVLMGATRLIDGTWDTPHPLGSALDAGGDSNYPFMMPDGVTLYYANNGPESIGGYDIFISRKDENGFLQPQNIGMPYNSTYYDYLLAIDEVGDRPQPSWRQNHNLPVYPVGFACQLSGRYSGACRSRAHRLFPFDLACRCRLYRNAATHRLGRIRLGQITPRFLFRLAGQPHHNHMGRTAHSGCQKCHGGVPRRVPPARPQPEGTRLNAHALCRWRQGRSRTYHFDGTGGRTRAYSPARDVQQSSARK